MIWFILGCFLGLGHMFVMAHNEMKQNRMTRNEIETRFNMEVY